MSHFAFSKLMMFPSLKQPACSACLLQSQAVGLSFPAICLTRGKKQQQQQPNHQCGAKLGSSHS